jgi:hypothetical protein
MILGRSNQAEEVGGAHIWPGKDAKCTENFGEKKSEGNRQFGRSRRN